MAASESPPADTTGEQSVTVSTGHTVELPVRLRVTMLGATFAAPRDGITELLPDGLQPI